MLDERDDGMVLVAVRARPVTIRGTDSQQLVATAVCDGEQRLLFDQVERPTAVDKLRESRVTVRTEPLEPLR